MLFHINAKHRRYRWNRFSGEDLVLSQYQLMQHMHFSKIYILSVVNETQMVKIRIHRYLINTIRILRKSPSGLLQKIMNRCGFWNRGPCQATIWSDKKYVHLPHKLHKGDPGHLLHLNLHLVKSNICTPVESYRLFFNRSVTLKTGAGTNMMVSVGVIISYQDKTLVIINERITHNYVYTNGRSNMK